MKIFICIVLTLLCSETLAGGVSIRGGANSAGLGLVEAFRVALAEIKANFPDLQAQIADLNLDALPESTSVIGVPTPLKVPAGEGFQDSVADNDYSSNIRVNEGRWGETSSDRIRQAIALHEFLCLKKVESTGHYPISSAYLAKFHMQNDAQILISGRDPVLGSRQVSERESCNDTMELQSLKSHETKTVRSFKMSAGARWHVLDDIYGISYAFGVESKDFVPVVTQFVRLKSENNDGTSVNTLSARMLGRDAAHHGRLVEVVVPSKTFYHQESSDGRTEVWSWKAGKKDQLESYFTQGALSNNSRWSRVDSLLRPSPEPGYRFVSASDECLSEVVPEESWIQESGDLSIALEIEKITARATMVNEADRAYKACTPENCKPRKIRLDSELTSFNRAWDQMYANRRVQILRR
jgi:hypothetical protein